MKSTFAAVATALLSFALSTMPAAAQSNDMVGKWDGVWPNGPTQTFQFDRIEEDGTVHGVISWGAAPKIGVKAGSVRVDHMKIVDGKFTLHDSKDSIARSEWVFENGAFSGARYEKSSPNTPTNRVVLKKVASRASNWGGHRYALAAARTPRAPNLRSCSGPRLCWHSGWAR